METKSRSNLIDILRFIGFCMISIYHIYEFKATYYGVLIFFVLSGYLITESLENKNYSYMQFIKRRIVKIYPPMIATIFFSILGYLYINQNLNLKLIYNSIFSILGLANINLIANNISYFESDSLELMFKHFWALAIEIQFYIFFPIIIFAMKKSNSSNKIKILVISFLAILSGCIMSYKFNNSISLTYLYYSTDTRIFSLFIGSLFFYLPFNRLKISNTLAYILSTILASVFIYTSVYFDYNSAFNYLGGMFALSVMIAIFINICISKNIFKANSKYLYTLIIIGRHSYPYYLVQYPLLLFVREYFKWSEVDYSVIVIVHIIATIIVAEIIYFCFEKGSKMSFKKILALLILINFTIYSAPISDTTEADNMKNIVIENDALLKENKENTLTESRDKLPDSEIFIKDNEDNNEDNKSEDVVLDRLLNGDSDSDNNNTDSNTIDLNSSNEPKKTDTIEHINSNPQKDTININKDIKDKNITTNNNSKNSAEKCIEMSVTFIGDSVMKMAEPSLYKNFKNSYVDAKVSRQFVVLPDLLKELKKDGHLNDIVVIHLGTNGVINKKTFDDSMAILKDKKVYFINCVVPKHWEKSVNSSLKEWANEYSNATIIDWYQTAKGEKELFYKDATHLNQQGVKKYISLIDKNIIKNN